MHFMWCVYSDFAKFMKKETIIVMWGRTYMRARDTRRAEAREFKGGVNSSSPNEGSSKEESSSSSTKKGPSKKSG
jgi:hypothetical protein